MTSSAVSCALLCVILVYSEATQIPNNTVPNLRPQLKTWSFTLPSIHNNTKQDETENEILEVFEGDAPVEVETFRPLVLNPNATYEQYQAQSKNNFLEWLLSFWGGGNHHGGSNNQGGGNNHQSEASKNCAPCKCGLTNKMQRIVGGVVTQVNQYSWVVELMNNNQFYCGGSAINTRYILTAAHCTVGVAKERMKVVFLEHDRSNPSETKTFSRKVANIYRHKWYNDNQNYNNDISLLRLAEPVQFSDKFRPVCLPSLQQSYSGTVGVVTGWGATAEYASTSNVLREVNVPIISNDDCRKTKYGNKITANMLCAGFVGKGGKDACQGDSGGPLHVANGTQYMIVGIVSWGEGCAERDYPGVYTRVNRYLSWIEANTKDSCYC